MANLPTLDEILAHKRLEVEALKARLRRTGSTSVMRALGQVRSFSQALSHGGLAIIPELKKADPWRGVFRPDYDALKLAGELEAAGATAMALQTDARYFHGSADDLALLSRRSKVPILARDFIVDEAQLTEAKSKGADACVLTAGLISEDELKHFMKFADYIMLEIVVEVANVDELNAALDAGATMIGVQNRDLKSQTVKLDRSLTLRAQIPEDRLTLSVGGVATAKDLVPLHKAGYHGVLVGETLMRASNPASTYQLLSGWQPL